MSLSIFTKGRGVNSALSYVTLGRIYRELITDILTFYARYIFYSREITASGFGTLYAYLLSQPDEDLGREFSSVLQELNINISYNYQLSDPLPIDKSFVSTSNNRIFFSTSRELT